MASTHIYPSTQTRLGGQLNSLVANTQRVKNEATNLKLIADQIASGEDFEALATEFGYATAAEAETAYNLLGSVLNDDINGNFFTQVIFQNGVIAYG